MASKTLKTFWKINTCLGVVMAGVKPGAGCGE